MTTVSNNDPHRTEKDAPRSTDRDRRPAHTEPTEAQIATEAAAIYPDSFETPPTADEIAEEAYAIYIARGAEPGHDQDDWFEAERRLSKRRSRK